MKQRFAIHQFVRQLGANPVERRLTAAALATLMRSRRRQLLLLALALKLMPVRHWPKWQLWKAMAWLCLDPVADPLLAAEARICRDALCLTEAFKQAQHRLQNSRTTPMLRGRNYQQLLQCWPPKVLDQLFIFHHYDRRGFFPRSWLDALTLIRSAGWQVLVSTSGLAPCWQERLHQAGAEIAWRHNRGRCLGAYKDLILLLQRLPRSAGKLNALVLCNDSTLPILEPLHLLQHLESWCVEGLECEKPILSGFTDSAETGRYHLQSYLLHANRALLDHAAWAQFWLDFDPSEDKQHLIQAGEIGLSQSLMAADVHLGPSYPLVAGLLADPGMHRDLAIVQPSQPGQVNQSLSAWLSLLGRGMPLVKKMALFDLWQQQAPPPSLALEALAAVLPPERFDLLASDLHDLFVSFYCDDLHDRHRRLGFVCASPSLVLPP